MFYLVLKYVKDIDCNGSVILRLNVIHRSSSIQNGRQTQDGRQNKLCHLDCFLTFDISALDSNAIPQFRIIWVHWLRWNYVFSTCESHIVFLTCQGHTGVKTKMVANIRHYNQPFRVFWNIRSRIFSPHLKLMLRNWLQSNSYFIFQGHPEVQTTISGQLEITFWHKRHII